APAHCFLWLCSHTKQCAYSEHTHTAHIVKQHTYNPLIAPHVNPFLPSVISTCFF
ncbi:unnamed protein product, partial [Staurois parvus]